MNPVTAVFGNDLLMDNILKYVVRKDQASLRRFPKSNVLDRLYLRTVSRSFNEAIIRNAQRQFSKFTIGYRRGDYAKEGQIAVSYCPIPIEKTRQLFEFLRKVMKVKVRSIEVIDIFRSSGLRKRLHSEIWESLIGDNYKYLNSVTGMEELCPRNCVHCPRVATQCHKYGPLQEDVLREAFLHAHHFHTLIVSDRLLNRIASRCTVGSETKEECLAALEEMVHSRLSCSHLILMVEEKPFKPEFRNSPELLETQPLPREVIDRMLRVWKVRSVEIRLHSNYRFVKSEWRPENTTYEYREPLYSSFWSDAGFLTPVRFDGDFREYPHGDLYLDYVTLNLEFAYFSMFPYLERAQSESSGYFNLVSIARRLFPTSRMRLELSRTLTGHNCFKFCDMREIIEIFKRICWRDDPTNFHLDIQFHTVLNGDINYQIDMNYADFDVEKGKVDVYEIPPLSYSRIISNTFLAKTFHIADVHKKSRSISLEVWVKAELLGCEHILWPRGFRDKISEITWDFIYAYRKWQRHFI